MHTCLALRVDSVQFTTSSPVYSPPVDWASLFDLHAAQRGIPGGLTKHLSMQRAVFMGDGCLLIPWRHLFKHTHQLFSKSMWAKSIQVRPGAFRFWWLPHTRLAGFKTWCLKPTAFFFTWQACRLRRFDICSSPPPPTHHILAQSWPSLVAACLPSRMRAEGG